MIAPTGASLGDVVPAVATEAVVVLNWLPQLERMAPAN